MNVSFENSLENSLERFFEGEEIFLPDIDWFIDQIRALPHERVSQKISEWAALKRSMPEDLTETPGPWDNTYAPYTVEIMDRLSPDDPARDVVVMKGGQTMFTTSVIENWLGFIIDNGLGPTQYISGSDEISKNSIELKLDAMVETADIGHKLKMTKRGSRNLSGNTTARKDFVGGFILAGGGSSTKRYRAIGIRNMIVDDLDELPEAVGVGKQKQGSLIELIRSRQRAFDKTRKTLFISTPIFTGGPTHKLFLLGDQREYFCPCVSCGYSQTLTFRGKREDGKRYGIYYELENDGTLILSSVGYKCKNCLGRGGRLWKDIDKYKFLNAAEWRPTQKGINPFFYSYYLDGLASPEYSWESMVGEWLRCWDSKNKRIKDTDALQVFMNTARGRPYEQRGQAPSIEIVYKHRRGIYRKGEIPNRQILEETGSPGLLLTCAVDVHKDSLDLELKLWCRNKQNYSIDWITIQGDTSGSRNDPWQKLELLLLGEGCAIDGKYYSGEWIADDGKRYYPHLTLIDASYDTSSVYDFCADFEKGVFPIMGRDMPPKNAKMRQFSEYRSKGLKAYNINVTLYKDRIAAWLKKDWNTGEEQPYGYPNFPEDYRDDLMKQLTAEEKKEKFQIRGGKRIGFFWEKIKQRPNHLWDCFVYNCAALDMLCYWYNVEVLEEDRIDYSAFWEWVIAEKPFYSE